MTSKYENYINTKNLYSGIINTISTQQSQGNRDKYGLDFRYSTGGNTQDFHFITSIYEGFFGSSSCYHTTPSKEMGEMIAQVLTELRYEIIKRVVDKCNKNIQAAAMEAKREIDEANNILNGGK